MLIQSFRDGRNMPFVKRGMRVEVYDGKLGRITGANRQMNLNIRIDGEKRSSNYHPQWQIKYFADDGCVIAEYKD